MSDPAIVSANGHVLASVEEQIRELQPGLQKRADVAVITAQLNQSQKLVGQWSDASLTQDLTAIINDVRDIETGLQSGQKSLSDFGAVLAKLYALQGSVDIKVQDLLNARQITNADKEDAHGILLNVIVHVRRMLNGRPDVTAIMDDLTAMKQLRGGPADATAFHDFHVLQLAFESVWMHAFDEKLKGLAAQLYANTVHRYEELYAAVPNFEAIDDINDLNYFIGEVRSALDSENPGEAIPQAVQIWA